MSTMTVSLVVVVVVMVMGSASVVDSRRVFRNPRTFPRWRSRTTRPPTTTLPPPVTATTTPPPSTTFPWLTTLPPGCVVGGERLYPGQQKTFFHRGGCQMCSCGYEGRLSCSYADCLVPMCVDAHRGPRDCCARCPHGRNCVIPMTGEVIQADLQVERQGMLCECPPQNYMLPGLQSEADYTAICIPVTTVPTTSAHIPVGRREA